MKCDCCNKEMIGWGCISRIDGLVICDECLKYAPNYYGNMAGKDLIKYIKNKKSKRWFQFWK